MFYYPKLWDARKWDLVEMLVQVHRHREIFDTKTKRWKTSHETAYYIATKTLEARTAADTIRGHWGVENACHWDCRELNSPAS